MTHPPTGDTAMIRVDLPIETPSGAYRWVTCWTSYIPGHPGSYHEPPWGPEVDVEGVAWDPDDDPPTEPSPPEGWARWIEDHYFHQLLDSVEGHLSGEWYDESDRRYAEWKEEGWR